VTKPIVIRFTVAHVFTGDPRRQTVNVYRVHRRTTLRAALMKAGQIRRAGYLVWIERTGSRATR
jgi:hypothetical protein